MQSLWLLSSGATSGTVHRAYAQPGDGMTARIPENASAWPVDTANMMPPRDPNDEDDDDENGDDESEDDEAAVIREPDE
jgi:hypothetical protein